MNFDLSDIPIKELKLDRRQRRTHQAVENALMELMQTKSVDSISVSELAEQADINRKTFYNNYDSVEAVLQEIHQRVTKHILSKLPTQITINNEIEIYNLLLTYTKAMEPHKQLLKQIRRHNRDFVVINDLKDYLSPYIEQNLTSYHVNAAVIPYITSYIMDGISCLCREWLEDEQLTAEQIALLGYNLTISAIKLDNYRDVMTKNYIQQ